MEVDLNYCTVTYSMVYFQKLFKKRNLKMNSKLNSKKIVKILKIFIKMKLISFMTVNGNKIKL